MEWLVPPLVQVHTRACHFGAPYRPGLLVVAKVVCGFVASIAVDIGEYPVGLVRGSERCRPGAYLAGWRQRRQPQEEVGSSGCM